MEIVIALLIILVIGLIIATTSGRRVFRLYDKYMQRPTYINCTGLDFACAVIKKENLPVKVTIGKGKLCDCYVPSQKILVLSPEVAQNASIASIGIAMHELGHAIQDRDKNFWFMFSNIFRKIAVVLDFLVAPLVLAGIVIMIFYPNIFDTGVWLLIIALGCWVLTFFVKVLLIPVEYGASRIAYNFLKENRVLQPKELAHTKHMLHAAALTYVGSLFSGLLNLIRRLR